MRVARTKEFETLTTKYNLNPDIVSEAIVSCILDGNDFEKDGHDIWGQDIKGVFDILEILVDNRIAEITTFLAVFETFPDLEELELFMSLVVIGDHDCPECGGEMNTIDSQLDVITDPNGVQEPYDRIIGELKECGNCNHRTEVGAYFD